MNDKKKAQNAFLEAISIMIDKKIKNLGFNYYVDGVIKEKNTNNTYNVLINNILYKNIPSKNNFEYMIGDTVQVLIKNGNWNKKIIDDKVGHDKLPQNILNLYNNVENIKNNIENLENNIGNIESNVETITNTYSNFGKCIQIEPNSDFNDYKTAGSYAVYSTVDAETIANIPCELAGKLDVYMGNGDTTSNNYVYIIQEYTSYDVQKRYYRYIHKSGETAEWEYTKWYEKLSTYNVQDYIVEQGTSDIWTYRKWNSGIAECFGCYSLSSDLPLSNTNNPLYWSDSQTTYLPTNLFKNIISCQISCESSPNIRWAVISSCVNSFISWLLVSTYTQTAKTGIKVTFDVKGKWK